MYNTYFTYYIYICISIIKCLYQAPVKNTFFSSRFDNKEITNSHFCRSLQMYFLLLDMQS